MRTYPYDQSEYLVTKTVLAGLTLIHVVGPDFKINRSVSALLATGDLCSIEGKILEIAMGSILSLGKGLLLDECLAKCVAHLIMDGCSYPPERAMLRHYMRLMGVDNGRDEGY